MPTAFSENWTAPAVEDFRLLTGPGEMPVLAFTGAGGTPEYVSCAPPTARAEEIAVLTGRARRGDPLCRRHHDLCQPAEYALLPRNGLLYARGRAADRAGPPGRCTTPRAAC